MVGATLVRDPRLRPSADQILLTLLGETGRGNVRAAATRVLGGTWPGVDPSAAGLDPTRLGGPTAAPARQGGAAGGSRPAVRDRQGAAAGYGAAGQGDRAYRGGQVPSSRQAAGYDGRYGQPEPRAGGRYAGGAADRAGRDAGRKRGGDYIRYEEPPAPAPAARRAPAREPVPYRPPYEPPAPARPAPPAPPPPAPAARRERPPRRRRGFRLRIPFKRTIIFVVIVLLLLSAADQIASALDRKRQAVWNQVTDRVERQIDDWRGKATADLPGQLNQLPGQVRDRFEDNSGSGTATGSPSSAKP